MLAVIYYTDLSFVTALVKLLATACLLLAAMYITITVIAPLITLVLFAAVKALTVTAIVASPLLIIKLQKASTA